MLTALLFTAVGYLSGGLLFAKYFGRLLARKDIVSQSDDKNPGAYNAFLHGGILCGCLTAVCDMLKGFLPVFIYNRFFATEPCGIAFVLAAPVFGHCFPALHKFKGGKGISATFGCLLGLMPELASVTVLGVTFIFFSAIIEISPNSSRTLFCFAFSVLILPFILQSTAVYFGFVLISCTVGARLAFACKGFKKPRLRIFPFIKRK